MKKNVALFVLLSFCLLSCERTDDKTYKAYYPSQFEMQGIKYICDYDWAVEHRNEYTLGKIIGYLIYIEDEEDFIKSYYLCWKNEHEGRIKSFCESLFAVFFSDQDSIDVNSVIKDKKVCAISK